MDALVTVIVPCHNRTRYLIECLDSVRSQNYPNIETIVVDDASTDSIESAVASVPWSFGKHPKVIRSENNIGPGASRELGRLAAQGEYICYQDSDDWWHPAKVAEQVRQLQQSDNAGMCYCTARQFTSLPISRSEPVRPLSDRAYERFLPMLLETQRRPWGTGACMWTRQAIELIGPWSSCWTWEDMEYDCRAGIHDIEIAFLDQSLCFYRTNYGQNQLRNLPLQKHALQKTDAIKLIGANLKQSGKLGDGRITAAYAWLLFVHSVLLLRIGSTQSAISLLAELENLPDSIHQLQMSGRLVRSIASSTGSARIGWLAGRSIIALHKQLMPVTPGIRNFE